jgi:hypothetical protein
MYEQINQRVAIMMNEGLAQKQNDYILIKS